MTDGRDPQTDLLEQASCLERLLPQLMRRLFTLEGDEPDEELSLAQLRVCGILEGCPRAISSIAEELGISASAVTQIADRLERATLVERVVEADDRRMKLLRLTERGEQIMKERHERRSKRAAHVLAPLAPDARAALLATVRELLGADAAGKSAAAGKNGAHR